MQIMQWPLSKITPYVRNARKIPPQGIDKVAASIQEFGWRQPIVVDAQGVIICGHAPLLAAHKLATNKRPSTSPTISHPARSALIGSSIIAATKRPIGTRSCWVWS